MGNERASLGFGDELESFDPAEWTPKKNLANERPKAEEARAAASAAGFSSREPMKPVPVATQRRRRTGRSAQFNVKAKPETIEAFCAIADGQGWGLGETLEYAVALLQKEYGNGQK